MNDIPALRSIFFYGTIDENWLGHQMAEIFRDLVYKPYLPLNKENTLALDIGGNIGLVSIYLSKYFDKIIALEPSKLHLDAFTRNMVSNNITNVTLINRALYIKNGKFPFGGPPSNRTMRSMHMATWNGGKPDEEIEAITFDKLFEDEKIEHVDLLKLDIEGTEVEVLSSEGFQKVASKIDIIVGESHHFTGRHPNQLNDALKNNGFITTKTPISQASDLFVARRK